MPTPAPTVNQNSTGWTMSSLMIVIFGRPGAGKSTISEEAIRLLSNHDELSKYHVLHLDLDVCVPQWMRENFSKGMYPTLQQRADFMVIACQHVTDEMNKAADQNATCQIIVVISFRFVNTDLRTYFRDVFPHAQWILIDANDELAQERILLPEGHFYNGNTSSVTTDDTDNRMHGKEDESTGNEIGNNNDDRNNSEWEFESVNFQHVILDGCMPANVNAKQIVSCIEQTISKQHSTV